MNRDQVKGRSKEATGKVKEEIGKLTGRKEQEGDGGVEKLRGKIQGDFGDLKSKLSK
ncbi:MAG: CsbD family protein [Acidithiobacillus ferrivorans]